MTEIQIIEKAKQVVKLEATAIANLIDKIDVPFAQTVQLIYNSTGRVVFTGMGKSGLIARKIVATLNSTGTAAIFLHPTDALHGDLGMVRKDDIVILISKSGNTEELLNLAPMIKRIGAATIGLFGDSNNKLSRYCDYILLTGITEEACPYDLAPTSSTTAALVLGDALAITLLEMRGFSANDFALLHPGGSLGKRLSLKISEIMIEGDDIPIVFKNTPLKDTILQITSKRLGMTCVTDDDGVLCGIVTDGDLRRLLEKSLDIANLRAEDVMSKNPKTISKDLLASYAIQQMEQFNITSLIVIDANKKPEGIVHLHDLVKLGLQSR